MKCNIQYAVMLFVLSALAGCASSGVVENASPIATNTPVSLDFALVKTSSSLSNSETEIHLLNEMIVMGLREKQMFGEVAGKPADGGASSGIMVNADIKGIKPVSKKARVWLDGREFQCK
jgi:hypothetical protein